MGVICQARVYCGPRRSGGGAPRSSGAKLWARSLGHAAAEMVGFDVAEDCGLDAAEGEVEVRALAAGWGLLVCGNTAVAVDARLDLAEGEGDGAGVAIGGEGVDPGAAGVAEAEELGDLVVGFAGGVIDRAAY